MTKFEEIYKEVVGTDKLALDSYLAEKLVHAVAKECADLCMKQYWTNDGWGHTNGDARCHKLICETFGIESHWG